MMSPLLEADCKTMMNLNDYPCTCEGNEEAKMDTLTSSVLRNTKQIHGIKNRLVGREPFPLIVTRLMCYCSWLFMNYGCPGLTHKACLYHKLF